MAASSTESPSATPRPGFLASPRAQRRLLWVSGLVLAAGVAVFLALVVFPGSSGTTATPPATTPVKAAKQPKTVAPSPAAIAVGRKFIETAVARKDLGSAYSLVGGDLKNGITKQQWEKGNIPVSPYPAGNASTTHFKTVWSHPKKAMFELTLVARHGSGVRPDLRFYLGVERAGGKADGRWLVDYWAPYYTIGIKPTP